MGPHGAELIVKVGSTGNHPDGEILYVANRRRIMQVHGEMICHVKRAGWCSPWGHRPIGLAYHWQDACYQYCFSRVGEWEAVRHDRHSGNLETFGRLPVMSDGRWQAWHLPLYLAHRLWHRRHRIFGLPGREIWFGGRYDTSMPVLERVWRRITMETGIAPESLRWPAGRLDLRNHLVLPLWHDLSDEDADGLVGQGVNWRDMLPWELIPLIEQRGRPVDLRRRGVAVSLQRSLQEVC